ncbi:TetR/AcrR family transcriptional regulator [Alteromonas oceanisediminis]|uniref:TetR/AcrR family transcriptional regulator n=1 Tax=Alteromonas oceanisediminis TaxID=2836180 RepID=UPI001BDA9FB6|nr:TetR/AcrR family transcriptional regulator [Alteromonas oceanisediminis]MBT0585963.1 TetR/AcrR family transcriptional regulator [Alteromonas oceanisediminis]
MSDKIAKLGRPKSEEKRLQILDCATELFLQNGFTNTSMDIIARKAGVAKQTVYSHFNNKDDLYTAVIGEKCHQYKLDASQFKDSSVPFQEVLNEMANQIVSLLQDPEVIAMHMIVIGESNNNPRVAELFYRAGPLQSVETVAGIFRFFLPSKVTTNTQAISIATDFFNLLKGDFYMRSMLQLPFLLSQEQQQRHCERVCQQISLMIDNLSQFPCTHVVKHQP